MSSVFGMRLTLGMYIGSNDKTFSSLTGNR